MEQYEAFDRVYDATKNALLRWLLPRIRSSADVEDLMQEIYRKLFWKMQTRGAVREPEKYLFGIAKRELARFYRKRAAVQDHETPLDEQLPDDEPSPEALALDRERMREVWAIVRTEPLPSYQAFALYYGFSVPTDEIAKELGLSEEAVRKRLSRTRARIRTLLAERETIVPNAERKGE